MYLSEALDKFSYSGNFRDQEFMAVKSEVLLNRIIETILKAEKN